MFRSYKRFYFVYFLITKANANASYHQEECALRVPLTCHNTLHPVRIKSVNSRQNSVFMCVRFVQVELPSWSFLRIGVTISEHGCICRIGTKLPKTLSLKNVKGWFLKFQGLLNLHSSVSSTTTKTVSYTHLTLPTIYSV